jgi:hypothetical protein
MCQRENLQGSSHLEDLTNELHYDGPDGKKVETITGRQN